MPKSHCPSCGRYVGPHQACSYGNAGRVVTLRGTLGPPTPFSAGTPGWLSPVVPGQIFTLGLTLAKGFDPDRPRGLRKITLTR